MKKFINKHFSLLAFAITVSAILPVGVFVASGQVPLRLSSYASEKREVRLWIEPELSVLTLGQKQKMTIYAEFDDESDLISKISGNLKSVEGIDISGFEMSLIQPFRGRKVVGSFEVSGEKPGKYELEIDKSSVDLARDDLDIISFKANVIVK